MSTRSLIARQTESGFEAIYCHNEGGPQHHAPILTRHYATDDAVAALLDLGDLSILGPQLGQAHAFATHGENDETQAWCLAYGRDRGDKNRSKRTYASEAEFLADAEKRWADYVYLFRDGRWLYRRQRDNEDWDELEMR